MSRVVAVLVLLAGLASLGVAIAGQTVWAPAPERTAVADLTEQDEAVVIDPGVMYVGGMQGEVTVRGEGALQVIRGSEADVLGYLENLPHTRITGVPDWETLATQSVPGEAAATEELADIADSDMWTSVDEHQGTATLDITSAAQEDTRIGGDYQATLVVATGEDAAIDAVEISWPSQASNDWVPYAYAGGIALTVLGTVLLVVALRSGEAPGRAEASTRGRRRLSPQERRAARRQRRANGERR
ncbi:MAG: hypothetical protein Q4G40_03260 [Brachybacterium sp.]|nr:hypothetical protein [Brachybacterium sp.]